MTLYYVLSTRHLFQRRRVPFVGIDDFAFKKRQRYGVIICDALTSQPIDLLPDRTVETLKSWLRNYPSIQRISRDRFARFREVIDQIFPLAIQIHDRFHLIQNLWTLHDRIIQKVLPLRLLKDDNQSSPLSPRPLNKQEKRRKQNVEKKWERALQVKKLKKEGYSLQRIAAIMNIDRRTAKEDLLKENPGTGERQKRIKPIDAWTEDVLSLVIKGHTVKEIYDTITKQGYKGSYGSVRVLVTDVRKKRKQGQTLRPSAYYTRREIRRVLWQWTFSSKEKDRALVNHVLKKYQHYVPISLLFRDFEKRFQTAIKSIYESSFCMKKAVK